MRHHDPGQRGAALLIALMAVALASLIAVALIERGQRTLARTEALADSARAWEYARGMHSLAVATLRRAQTGEIDPAVLDGVWSEPFEVPGGVIQGRLLDQGARFNLNALDHPDSARAALAAETFARLLELLGLDPVIADELQDWIEGERVARPGSAADEFYMRQDPPYRTSGTRLAHASELRWLRSVDNDAWQRLAGRVTALPEPELAINVNAAGPEIVAALFPEMEIADARRVLADGPFADRQGFAAHPIIAARAEPARLTHIVTEGRWFRVQARVTLDGVERDYFRLLKAEGTGYDEFRYFSQGVP